ncbi:response regulator transcription factor [Streptomyces xiangluensis]|uniref:Response regulator transcription factor n=1 Tax=Streptomyces xiangluensis TaxID=2665720 RepID=A0ABV8YMJ1_9ACTN
MSDARMIGAAAAHTHVPLTDACPDCEGTTTVLIEPHTVTRTGLRHMLEEAGLGADVVAVATPDDVPAERLGTCVTLMLSVGALSGVPSSLSPLLARSCTRLVLLAGALDRERLHLAAELPVDAVVREQDLSVESLAEMLGALRRGMVSVSRNTMRELLALATDPAGTWAPTRPPLSARELDTLRLMSAGLSNRQIAKSMCITVHGVKRHVANILVKLGCQNRTMAVTLGLRLGLVDWETATRT